jgi:hypothetical protein
MSQPPSPEDELGRHSEPDHNGLIAAACRFKTPLLDGFHGGLVEVRMTRRALNLDLSHPAVLQDLKEQGRGAGDTLAPRGIGVSRQELIPAQRARQTAHPSAGPLPPGARS